MTDKIDTTPEEVERIARALATGFLLSGPCLNCGSASLTVNSRDQVICEGCLIEVVGASCPPQAQEAADTLRALSARVRDLEEEVSTLRLVARQYEEADATWAEAEAELERERDEARAALARVAAAHKYWRKRYHDMRPQRDEALAQRDEAIEQLDNRPVIRCGCCGNCNMKDETDE